MKSNWNISFEVRHLFISTIWYGPYRKVHTMWIIFLFRTTKILCFSTAVCFGWNCFITELKEIVKYRNRASLEPNYCKSYHRNPFQWIMFFCSSLICDLLDCISQFQSDQMCKQKPSEIYGILYTNSGPFSHWSFELSISLANFQWGHGFIGRENELASVNL